MIRRERWKSNFSQIPNATLRDTSLSNSSFRLLMYMLSMADGWIFRNSQIAKHFGKSERWVQSGLTELEKAGYVQRRAIKNKSGKIESWERIVYDLPGAENVHMDIVAK
jgi:DNA-binding MarR family transcriptional regulator